MGRRVIMARVTLASMRLQRMQNPPQFAPQNYGRSPSGLPEAPSLFSQSVEFYAHVFEIRTWELRFCEHCKRRAPTRLLEDRRSCYTA
jgi:hypothetical protein